MAAEVTEFFCRKRAQYMKCDNTCLYAFGAELIYGNTGGMIGRTNEKQQNIGIFMAVAAHGFMFSSG